MGRTGTQLFPGGPAIAGPGGWPARVGGGGPAGWNGAGSMGGTGGGGCGGGAEVGKVVRGKGKWGGVGKFGELGGTVSLGEKSGGGGARRDAEGGGGGRGRWGAAGSRPMDVWTPRRFTVSGQDGGLWWQGRGQGVNGRKTVTRGWGGGGGGSRGRGGSGGGSMGGKKGHGRVAIGPVNVGLRGQAGRGEGRLGRLMPQEGLWRKGGAEKGRCGDFPRRTQVLQKHTGAGDSAGGVGNWRADGATRGVPGGRFFGGNLRGLGPGGGGGCGGGGVDGWGWWGRPGPTRTVGCGRGKKKPNGGAKEKTRVRTGVGRLNRHGGARPLGPRRQRAPRGGRSLWGGTTKTTPVGRGGTGAAAEKGGPLRIRSAPTRGGRGVGCKLPLGGDKSFCRVIRAIM